MDTPLDLPFRFICILSAPRTGSSNLIVMLRSCRELKVKGELFHPTHMGHFSKRDMDLLGRRSKGAVQDRESLGLWRRKHPRGTLEALFKSGKGRPIVFKLFPGHLTQKRIISDIFARDDVAYILLRRRPIESFISGQKARIVQTHGKVDTTEIKPSLTVASFLEWSGVMKDWYVWLQEEVSRRALPCVEISYEEYSHKSNAEALAMILASLRALGLQTISMPENIQGISRQDTEPDFRNRVDNWDAFEKEAALIPDAAKLLEWALAEP